MPQTKIQISHKEYLRYILHFWPDKEKILDFLADEVNRMRDGCPGAGSRISCNIIAKLGMKIEQAKSADDCFSEFKKVLEYFNCPEPGWELGILEFTP